MTYTVFFIIAVLAIAVGIVLRAHNHRVEQARIEAAVSGSSGKAIVLRLAPGLDKADKRKLSPEVRTASALSKIASHLPDSASFGASTVIKMANARDATATAYYEVMVPGSIRELAERNLGTSFPEGYVDPTFASELGADLTELLPRLQAAKADAHAR